MDSPNIATPQRQDGQDTGPPPRVSASRNRVIDHSPRILSLDGGGIRGLSALLILKGIIDAVHRKSGNHGLLPCQLFDLIGGTSTGGLIAIMLGRLGMVTARKSCFPLALLTL
jgi:Patatin-like phospholipase